MIIGQTGYNTLLYVYGDNPARTTTYVLGKFRHNNRNPTYRGGVGIRKVLVYVTEKAN